MPPLRPWWTYSPQLQDHIYWYRKNAFQLASDRYPLWVMFAVEEGEFAYRIGDEQGTATFGEAVLCPPDTDFERTVLDSVSFHYLMFSWKKVPTSPEGIAPPVKHGHMADAPVDGGNERPPASLPVKLSFTGTERLRSTYGLLRETFRQRGDNEASSLYSTHLLEDLFRQYLYEAARTPALPGDEGYASTDPLMDRAFRSIRERAFQAFSLADLASRLGLTPVQLTRKYRQAFGTTPSDHLTGLRLQKAGSLLAGTSLTLDHIAEQCGYENGFYLSRIFTKRLGMTPSAYRRTYRV